MREAGEVQPPHECLSLTDYRIRHAQYRTDPGLQALMASVPMIAVWDDHEVCNNTFVTGAANHTAGVEGDYVTRRDAALKAYHEWLPVRTPDTADLRRIYRSDQAYQLLVTFGRKAISNNAPNMKLPKVASATAKTKDAGSRLTAPTTENAR